MRTNVVVDDQLMKEALRLSGAKSKREAVELGLKVLISLKTQEEIKAFRGKLEWEGNLSSMRSDE